MAKTWKLGSLENYMTPDHKIHIHLKIIILTIFFHWLFVNIFDEKEKFSIN